MILRSDFQEIIFIQACSIPFHDIVIISNFIYLPFTFEFI